MLFFFVDIEYEKVPEYCTFCTCIGHSIHNCKRKENVVKGKEVEGKKVKDDKAKPAINVPNLEFQIEENVNNITDSNKDEENNNIQMGETSTP